MFGNRISLISKSLIRYVGTLKDVNEKEETISLEQVRSMGTEGRRGNPMEEIPPSNDVYEFIQFRATDVLSVEFENGPAQAPAPPQIPNDPAILEARAQTQDRVPAQQPPSPPAQAQAQTQIHAQAGEAQAQAAAPARPAPTHVVHQAAAPVEGAAADHQHRQGSYSARGNYGSRGRGGYSNGGGRGARRGNYQGRGGYHGRRIEVPESDFDFESSNSKLNKDDLAEEFARLNVQVTDDQAADTAAAGGAAIAAVPAVAVAASSATVAANGTGYTPKTSFFDDISCESKERMMMREHGMSVEERRSRQHAERQQNYETFGQAAAEQNRYRYNRYHAGGRGGYNNNNNNNGSNNSNWRGRGRGYYRSGGPNRNQGGYGRHQAQSQQQQQPQDASTPAAEPSVQV
ncbi:hypothetical protein GGF46_003184 [Coemansia sp. RSA 552]|nr:hypothetical protein GGF46_003184 [Coemansia sp. RSA 552]